MNFDHPYNNDSIRSDLFGTFNAEPSMTQQSDKDDCDINVIVDRFIKTGRTPPTNAVNGLGGDFTLVTDYRTAIDYIRTVEETFSQIDAKVREKFDNNPGKFLEFVQDPSNLPELEKLGLTNPKPTPPEPVRVIMDQPANPPETGGKK